MILEEFQTLSKKSRRKRMSRMTEEEKLELIDAIIDRDAEFWKERARVYCDFGYYLDHIDGGIALTERQR